MRRTDFSKPGRTKEGAGNTHHRALGNRGVALIIVLLVTALLIALVFEFAYGTRVSLRAAVNFRNSQRAYFLARSGLSFFAKYPQVRDYIPQGEYREVPYISEGDKQVFLRWEDEAGKVDISRVLTNDPIFLRLSNLFSDRKVDQQILNNMALWMTENKVSRFYLLSDLHRFMSDEEFEKVSDALTVSQLTQINVNTASLDVLKTVVPADAAESIHDKRKEQGFTQTSLAEFLTSRGISNLASALTTTSTVFKVDLLATVGGFTRHIETIVNVSPGGGSNAGYTVKYWREL